MGNHAYLRGKFVRILSGGQGHRHNVLRHADLIAFCSYFSSHIQGVTADLLSFLRHRVDWYKLKAIPVARVLTREHLDHDGYSECVIAATSRLRPKPNEIIHRSRRCKP